MVNLQEKITLKQLVRLAKQLNNKDRLVFLQELTNELDYSVLQSIQVGLEQKLEQKRVLSDVNVVNKNFELKKINDRYYAYLRWRENGHHKSKYLGPMPFRPGYTYTLINKKDNTKKTFSPIGLTIEGDQVYLKIQTFKPVNAIINYMYPECLGTVFSKKEWIVHDITLPALLNDH